MTGSMPSIQSQFKLNYIKEILFSTLQIYKILKISHCPSWTFFTKIKMGKNKF